MKTRRIFLLAGLAIGAAIHSPMALANPQIAKANKCFECHSLDKRIIGPSFRDIAQKYKNQPGATNYLADKVRKGSVGVWGSPPMQAYPDMPQQDINSVVKWILDR